MYTVGGALRLAVVFECVATCTEWRWNMNKLTLVLLSFALIALFSPRRLEAAEAGVSAERAAEIALAASGGGKMVLSRSDIDDGRREYEITILNDGFRHEIDVDAASGTVTDHERSPVYQAPLFVANATVSRQQAEEKALDVSGGGDIISFEVDTDDGMTKYEIDVANAGAKHEIELDANSGAVLKHSVEF